MGESLQCASPTDQGSATTSIVPFVVGCRPLTKRAPKHPTGFRRRAISGSGQSAAKQ